MNATSSWPDGLLTLRQALTLAGERFEAADLYFGHGTDNAWDEAVALALHVLKLPVDADVSWLDRPLAPGDQANFFELCRRRIDERVPAAYLTGKAWFAGLEFAVTPDVLVPRSPFAELIENGFQPWLTQEPATVLDLCTGSGCIGIATALLCSRARVDLSDISRAALVVAEHNILAHGVHDRVRAVAGDLFSGLDACRYDLIVCNPPYVNARDLAAMPAEYRAEPEIGLAGGPDGLDFVRRLLHEAGDHLTDEGVLFVEVGDSWEALEQAYPRVPFTWLEFERGGHGVFMLSAAEVREFL